VVDVGPLGAWDDFSVARVHVLYDGERYQMFYEGHDGNAHMSWRVGYAWSEDGVTWHKDPSNPIVDMGPSGEFDDSTVSEPYVIFDGGTYRLYYSAYDGDKYRIGLATARPVYEPEGVLVSAPVDGERRTYWGELAWTCRLPEGTDVRLEVATSDGGETWSDWQVAAEGSAGGENSASLLGLDLPPLRYFRYRATLATVDPARSPVLEEVTVTEAAGDFMLEVEPTTLALPLGGEGSYSVGMSPRYGFDGAVSLAVTGLPDGVVAYVGDDAVALPAEVSLSVSSDTASLTGTHPLTIEAVAASGITHAVGARLVLLAPTPTPTPTATPTARPTPQPTATLASTPTSTLVPSPLASGSPLVVAGVAGLVAFALAVVGFLVRRAGRSLDSEERPDRHLPDDPIP
jgi:hypothetical protein